MPADLGIEFVRGIPSLPREDAALPSEGGFLLMVGRKPTREASRRNPIRGVLAAVLTGAIGFGIGGESTRG